jgi:hypothetical protein
MQIARLLTMSVRSSNNNCFHKWLAGRLKPSWVRGDAKRLACVGRRQMVKEDLSEVRDDVAVPRELMLQFVLDTFLTALTWCLEKRPKLAPSQINDMFRHFVTRGIGRAIVANGR